MASSSIVLLLSVIMAASLSGTAQGKAAQKSNSILPETPKYRDCHEWRKAGSLKSGVHVIYPNGTYPVKVHCQHGVNESYTVIQRRVDGTINFYTTWYYYKIGFGHATTDYWAGLDTINHLTMIGNNKLRIDMQDFQGNIRYALYSHFLILNEANSYRLSVSGFSGNVPGDAMAHHNGMMFATPDRPDKYQCAVHQRSGWWFNYCAYTLPNGIYYYGGPYTPTTGYFDGIYWYGWHGFGYSLKFISMSLQR